MFKFQEKSGRGIIQGNRLGLTETKWGGGKSQESQEDDKEEK